MKRIATILFTVACLMIAGCTATDPHRLIEKHLGVSAAGARILDDALSHPQDNPPDVGLLLHELSELKQDRNLTLGIVLMKTDPDLMVTNFMTSANPAAQCRAVLSNNTTSAGTTLVRPEDISNIIIETDQNGRTIGRFDWSVPGLIRGTSRFVAKGNTLEYLGVLRKNPVGTYDCETMFSRHGNIFASQQWIQTEYFAVVEPASETARSLGRTAQIRALQELLHPHGVSSFHWRVRDQTLPPVYSGHREDRDKVIASLKDSDDWNVTMSGRAVGHMFEEPLHVSIEEQIKKAANK